MKPYCILTDWECSLQTCVGNWKVEHYKRLPLFCLIFITMYVFLHNGIIIQIIFWRWCFNSAMKRARNIEIGYAFPKSGWHPYFCHLPCLIASSVASKAKKTPPTQNWHKKVARSNNFSCFNFEKSMYFLIKIKARLLFLFWQLFRGKNQPDHYLGLSFIFSF